MLAESGRGQPQSPPPNLSKDHLSMLLDESAIDPEIVRGRGYRTSPGRADAPATFKPYQRRAGLVMPMYSPDGESTSHQLRPDRPRKDKGGDPIKYETPAGAPIIADVHPCNLDRARDPAVPLWITEGLKKGDALASRGACAISLIGVWMFRRPKSAEMLSCFDHVPLSGRLVSVVFDSDVMVKAGVQLALERLVGDLEDRGAQVRVVYLPDGEGGGKRGVDDYLAAGGDLGELGRMARPFEPGDLAGERMSRDERLAAAINDLWGTWDRHDWKGWGGHTRRSIFRAMIEAAAMRGKLAEGGVRVEIGQTSIAEGIGTRQATVSAGLKKLAAEDELIGRAGEPQAGKRATAYVLKTSAAANAGAIVGASTGGTGGRARAYSKGHTPCKSVVSGEREHPSGDNLSPPSGAALTPFYTPLRGLAELKRLRWSYVRRVWTREGTEYEYVERLGKIKGHAIERLIERDGRADIGELAAAMKIRARDLKRRHLSKLSEAGIVVVGEGGVRLAPDWHEKLFIARELAGEYEAENLARDRHKRAREAERRKDEHPADPEPEMPGFRPAREPAPEPSTPLAAAIDAYLQRNPQDADQPAGWLGSTLWAFELYAGRPSPAEVKAEIEALGGDEYRRRLLARARGAA